ncbi:zinc metalloprotease [Vibrio cyclitrophicus 1F175]|uniref:SprT-like domain-containing protein n=1 Tax=Vibrio TaxID=662 RepID=UPI0002E79DD8|nr:SprT-like domain-containing protein [Vibrio cyclitrophicus]OEF63551.1 zinc metalloprotease [Vibrio cyclitrophicus 1F175]
MDTPTQQLYGALQTAYDHFNKMLFENELPPVLFTTQRQKNVMGYFSLNRWVDRDDVRCSEIAINPAYVGRSALIELLQTMVHEMAHCWQFEYGKPSRRAYHNKEWAVKMESIGLMPSTTGKPGGKKTGQRMNDYPIPGGRFIAECEVLVRQGFGLPWVDRFSVITATDNEQQQEIMELLNLDDDISEQLISNLDTLMGNESSFDTSEIATAKAKVRYSCPMCNLNLWGKPGLSVSCNDCKEVLNETSKH